MSGLVHHPLDSSMLQSAGHDEENDVIEIRFSSGKTYKYRGTADDFQALLSAPSHGKWFNENLRGKEAR
jgi:hypothetical protein